MIRIAPWAALLAALTAVPCLAHGDPQDSHAAESKKQAQPKIQLAILLDTSSSMNGLINQTREQLWRIVNTFATARRDGVRPRLELALYQYGNDGLRSKNWIQQMVPLTTDLDRVSEALYKLTTNGGSEFCGAAIDQSVNDLEWSQDPKDLKLIYIAGNEPFTQGPIDSKAAVKRAIARGIVVNTIHAGSEQQGISGGWMEAARLADGNFLTIDQNRAVARVAAPQDAELARLNGELNRTYVGFGRQGAANVVRQEAQDKNAAGMSAGSLATRAASKSSAYYDNSDWDLVDARKKGKKVADLKPAELPPEMQKMDEGEREAFVQKKAEERKAIQSKIANLAKEREGFVQSELKKNAVAGEKTLDEALIESVRTQAAKSDFAL